MTAAGVGFFNPPDGVVLADGRPMAAVLSTLLPPSGRTVVFDVPFGILPLFKGTTVVVVGFFAPVGLGRFPTSFVGSALVLV